MASPFVPEYLILHDYGGSPGASPSFNPYHALISGGRVVYRDPQNPYGAPAPHAFKLNPRSIGLSWGGPVGGTPNQAELDLLRKEVAAIKERFPNIKIMSHGEAYAQTKGTPYQASRDGRGLEEAAWRRYLEGTGPMPETAPAEVPVAQRGITAGHPAAAPKPAPMPFSLAAPVTPASVPETPAAAPAAVAGLSLPFGLSLGKSDKPLDPFQGDDELQATSPTAGLQRRPLDLSGVMRLASIKRGGIL